MPLVCYIIHLGLNATSYEPRSVVLSVQRPVSYFLFRHYHCKDHLIVIYSIIIIGMLISDLGLIVMLAQRAMSSKLKSYLKPTFAHKHSAHHNIQNQQTQPNAESLAQPKCPTTSTEPISFTEVFRHLQHCSTCSCPTPICQSQGIPANAPTLRLVSRLCFVSCSFGLDKPGRYEVGCNATCVRAYLRSPVLIYSRGFYCRIN